MPVGHGPLVEAKGGDDGLKRAAVGQQGDDADEQGPALVQAIKGGALGGGKGPAAAGTAEAPLLAGVNADVASAHLAPVRALRVVTECHRGVHGSPPFRSRLASLPVRMFPGPPFDYLAFRPSTVSWGAITLSAPLARAASGFRSLFFWNSVPV